MKELLIILLITGMMLAIPINAFSAVPACNGQLANIYVENSHVVGGELDGQYFRARLIGTNGSDVIVGTNGHDIISGHAGNDLICGRGGNDKIGGGKGKDTIYGEAGHDLIIGRRGNDTLIGGEGDDSTIGGAGSSDICDAEIEESCELEPPLTCDTLSTYYADIDKDGYGDINTQIEACMLLTGFVSNSNDCDDLNSDIYPGATDIPGDGLDQDCDGIDSPIVTGGQ